MRVLQNGSSRKVYKLEIQNVELLDSLWKTLPGWHPHVASSIVLKAVVDSSIDSSNARTKANAGKTFMVFLLICIFCEITWSLFQSLLIRFDERVSVEMMYKY